MLLIDLGKSLIRENRKSTSKIHSFRVASLASGSEQFPLYCLLCVQYSVEKIWPHKKQVDFEGAIM